MDILKELHASVAATCEASFDIAYRDLESKLARQEAELKETNRNVSVANEARQAAEHQVKLLQQEALALHDALENCYTSPEQLELPLSLTNLEDEFAPKYVWREGLRDVNTLQRILENKYSALYETLQTVVSGWSDLKTKVLQHKKKLRHWEKQLEREEFTLLLHGALVTFRRVHAVDSASKTSRIQAPGADSMQPSCSEPRPSATSHFTPRNWVMQNTDSTTPKPRIKTEHTSQQLTHGHPLQTSSDTPLRANHSMDSEPSSDPAHPLPDLQTRKRKRICQSSHAHPTEGGAQNLVSAKNEPVSSSPLQSSAHSLGRTLLSTQDLDDIGDTVQTPTKRHVGRGLGGDDRVAGSSSNRVTGRRDTSNQSAGNASALQLLDENTQALKRTDMEQRSHHRAAVLMAEDGDDGDHDGQPSKQTPKNTPNLHQAHGQKEKRDTKSTQNRLHGLLEGSPPPGSLFSAFRIEAATRSKGRGPVELPRARNPFQPDENAPEVRPEDEPYRLWPIHRLSVDSFKINPARNHGRDFAYDSVTRKKDERKCLSGCTRPGCCGDRFRAMARLGGPSANPTAEQTEEEQQILEEFLGDDRKRLKQLSAHDRENLLVEARARMLANQYGRHRHSHQRAPSPPGFWRTDMPSTQEIESDRQAAHRQEREKVEERYREAMRPGGLWKFADE